MSSGLLRLAVAGLVLVLLARAAAGAWEHRALAVTVWRRVRPRHVAGAVVLLTVVATLAWALLAVPALNIGLGTLVGFGGNAVFVPLEEAATRGGPVPATGPDWYMVGLATAFLAFLGLLLPWLAFVEEEIFRAGLEVAGFRREAWAALKFGLLHLVMLVPLAAALAIAVAGFVYGRLYRGAYARHAPGPLPPSVIRAYRPTSRARRAAAVVRLRAACAALAGGPAEPVEPPPDHPLPEHRQASAVLASTVWHTTFNSLVVGLLWLVIVADALV
jgi:hypothetical protein